MAEIRISLKPRPNVVRDVRSLYSPEVRLREQMRNYGRV